MIKDLKSVSNQALVLYKKNIRKLRKLKEFARTRRCGATCCRFYFFKLQFLPHVAAQSNGRNLTGRKFPPFFTIFGHKWQFF